MKLRKDSHRKMQTNADTEHKTHLLMIEHMERWNYYLCFFIKQGGDLDLKLQAWKKEGKSVDKSVVLTWFVQLVLAVQYIHQRRVLHRDLKTRNIFLRNNIVKIGKSCDQK